MRQRNDKDSLEVKMQLYQKWQSDYQKHQKIAKKEQNYLKQKKREIDLLWGEISAIYMQRLTDALQCEPGQVLERLQELPVNVTGSKSEPLSTDIANADLNFKEMTDDGTSSHI